MMKVKWGMAVNDFVASPKLSSDVIRWIKWNKNGSQWFRRWFRQPAISSAFPMASLILNATRCIPFIFSNESPFLSRSPFCSPSFISQSNYLSDLPFHQSPHSRRKLLHKPVKVSFLVYKFPTSPPPPASPPPPPSSHANVEKRFQGF